MTEPKTPRSTLGLKDTSDAEPALNKKGRGWKISDKRLDELHDRAREMRRFATPANKALAAKFAGADLGRYTFKRFAVVGSANLGQAFKSPRGDSGRQVHVSGSGFNPDEPII